jgi:hypothetical protein
LAISSTIPADTPVLRIFVCFLIVFALLPDAPVHGKPAQEGAKEQDESTDRDVIIPRGDLVAYFADAIEALYVSLGFYIELFMQ